MEEFKVITHVRFGKVRRVELEKMPWYVGRDIGSILGYAKPDGFVRTHVADEDKKRVMVPAFDFLSKRKGIIVNERGVEAMLAASSSPSAPDIRAWLLGDKEPAPVEEPATDLPTVIEISGVHGYIDKNNVAHINAEDAARGLGFVKAEEKVSPTGGRKIYEVVRWERVNDYLKEFGYSQKVGKNDFIPESMFYRLAMKASNAAAQKFQAKVADEIMPSIRKYGYYVSPKIANKNEEVIRLKKQYARSCSELAVVYALIMGNGTVKIGMTKDLTDRIKQIEAETGLDVWDFASTRFMPREDAEKLEAALKEKFSADCIGGEFFDVKFSLVAADL